MGAEAKLKGRPTSKDRRSLRYQCDRLTLNAVTAEDKYILAAIYRSIFVVETPVTRSIIKYAKQLYKEETVGSEMPK